MPLPTNKAKGTAIPCPSPQQNDPGTQDLSLQELDSSESDHIPLKIAAPMSCTDEGMTIEMSPPIIIEMPREYLEHALCKQVNLGL